MANDGKDVLERIAQLAEVCDDMGYRELSDELDNMLVRRAQRIPWSQLLNSQGPQAISKWQTFLNSNVPGANLKVDGIFGPRTKQATMQFQKAKGIRVDGLVGPETLGAAGMGSQPAGAKAPAPARPAQQPARAPAKPPVAPQAQPASGPQKAQAPAQPTSLQAKVANSVSGVYNQVKYLGQRASTADEYRMGPLVDRFFILVEEFEKRFAQVAGTVRQYAERSNDQQAVEQAVTPLRQTIALFRSVRQGSFDPKIGGLTTMFSAGRMGERLEQAEQVFRNLELQIDDIVGAANLS